MTSRCIRSFTETLGFLNRGRFSEKCDEHLQRAIEELQNSTAEKGVATVTVTLTIAYDQERIEVKPSIKSKLPEEKGFTGTPFWALDGGLSVQHPSQADMFGPRDVTPRRDAASDA